MQIDPTGKPMDTLRAYAGIDRGPYPVPPITIMIAGMRCFGKINLVLDIDLLSDIRIDGFGDTVRVAQELLEKMVTRKITPDEAYVEAVTRWLRSQAGDHVKNVADGVRSMGVNYELFCQEAQQWLSNNPSVGLGYKS